MCLLSLLRFARGVVRRCSLDIMRLVELLIVLIMEGRKALPKAVQPLVSRRMENFPGDRSHRHVIEAIRAGNNDEFFEAMESGECFPAWLHHLEKFAVRFQ